MSLFVVTGRRCAVGCHPAPSPGSQDRCIFAIRSESAHSNSTRSSCPSTGDYSVGHGRVVGVTPHSV
jgi:hypothetical protein